MNVIMTILGSKWEQKSKCELLACLKSPSNLRCKSWLRRWIARQCLFHPVTLDIGEDRCWSEFSSGKLTVGLGVG